MPQIHLSEFLEYSLSLQKRQELKIVQKNKIEILQILFIHNVVVHSPIMCLPITSKKPLDGQLVYQLQLFTGLVIVLSMPSILDFPVKAFLDMGRGLSCNMLAPSPNVWYSVDGSDTNYLCHIPSGSTGWKLA